MPQPPGEGTDPSQVSRSTPWPSHSDWHITQARLMRLSSEDCGERESLSLLEGCEPGAAVGHSTIL